METGTYAEKKQLIRACGDKIKLVPDSLEVEITYKLPEPVVIHVVAGGYWVAVQNLIGVHLMRRFIPKLKGRHLKK